jgi:hypothetical protein
MRKKFWEEGEDLQPVKRGKNGIEECKSEGRKDTPNMSWQSYSTCRPSDLLKVVNAFVTVHWYSHSTNKESEPQTDEVTYSKPCSFMCQKPQMNMLDWSHITCNLQGKTIKGEVGLSWNAPVDLNVMIHTVSWNIRD